MSVVQAAAISALAILAGVAGGVCLDVGGRVWLAALTLAWIIAAASFIANRARVFTCGFAVGCAAAGGALGHHDASAALDPPILRQMQPVTGEPLLVEGRLRDDAELTEFGVGVTVDLTRVWIADRGEASAGGARLSVGGQLAADARDTWRGGRQVRAIATLRRPQAYRNFGTPDQESATALRGTRLFGSVKSAALVELVSRGSWWREAGAAARAHVRQIVDTVIGVRDREAAAIVTAVLIGDRAGLTGDIESRLQRAGTFHVIAISGGNIAILVGAALWALRRLGLSPRTQAACALGAIVTYAGIVSGGSSVARATLAASLYLVARTLDHRAAARTIVAVTAGAVLLARPLLVVDAGFWLTFVASMAILEQAVSVAERLQRVCRAQGGGRLRAVARGALTLLAATAVAEASLAPIVAFTFAQVTAAGLALNFVAIPLMSVVQIAGMATVLCGAIHPALAGPAGTIAILAAHGITESARLVDFVSWSAPRVPPPPLWLATLAVVLWWSAWWLPRRGLRRMCGGLWALAMIAIVAGWPIWPTEPAPWLPRRIVSCVAPSDLPSASGRSLRVTFLDVAQGSATLVRFPDGSSLLVDAGGAPASRFDIGARVVAPALWALGLRRLGAVVLTHGDLDHIGGAGAVLDRFTPDEVWEGVPVATSEPLRLLAARAATVGARWTRVYGGASRTHGEVTLGVWHPSPPDWERPRVRNDDSIVIELRWGAVSIVLPGDIGSDVERELASQLAPAPLRVLLAAHHGSRQSTSEVWLDALAPQLAIVSAGRDNRFGHPAPAVLDRLAARNIRVLRTDRDGAIQLDTDGHAIRVVACGGGNEWMASAGARGSRN